MIGAGQVYFDAGNNFSNFDETKLLNNLKKLKQLTFKTTNVQVSSQRYLEQSWRLE